MFEAEFYFLQASHPRVPGEGEGGRRCSLLFIGRPSSPSSAAGGHRKEGRGGEEEEEEGEEAGGEEGGDG